MIGIRFALYGVLSGLFGLSAFSLYGLRTVERREAVALRPWLTGFAFSGLLLSVFALVLLAASMAGTAPWPIDRDAIGAVLTGTATGAAWKARVAALMVAGLTGTFAAGRGAWLSVVAAASAVALATLAWAGHGAMDEGAIGWAHLIADFLHLLAAGAWVGALLGLLLLVVRPTRRVDAAHLQLTHRALHGFGKVGTVVVATIVVTGMVNGWVLVGPEHVTALGTTPYGRLLAAKLVLFAAMLGLASLNRFRLTPGLERSIATADHASALTALRRSLAIEATLAVSVLGLVAWLGMLEPPATI